MSDITFREFSIVNRARSESPDGFNHYINDWSLNDWITATVGELGEAANIAKKLKRIENNYQIKGNKQYEDQRMLRDALAKELADVYIYLDLLIQSQGLDIQDIITKKFDEKSKEIGFGGRWNNK